MRSAWIVGPILLAAPASRAEEKTANVTLAGDVSATDNAFSAPSGNREPDMYAGIRPGILFGYATPRSTYEGIVEGELFDYLRFNDQLRFQFRGALRAQFQPGPDSDLSFNAEGSTGKTNVLAPGVSPDQTVVQVTPTTSNSAGVDQYQAGGGQNFGIAFGRNWRVTEGLSGRWSKTRDPAANETQSSEGGLELGIDRSWDDNALTLQAGATVTRLARFTPATDTMDATGEVNRAFQPRLTLSWRHDLSREWSSVLTGGVGMLIPFGTDDYNPERELADPLVAPLASASLAYTQAWGAANLSIAHAITPNLLIAQNTIGDTATLTAAVPLTWLEASKARAPRYVASGNLSFGRTEIVGTDATTDSQSGVYYVGRLDAGLSYATRPNAIFALRYTLTHQVGDDPATGGANMGAIIAPSFTTNTVTFTFSYRYPNNTPVVGKKQKSLRADGSDLDPLNIRTQNDDEDPNAKGAGGNAGGFVQPMGAPTTAPPGAPGGDDD